MKVLLQFLFISVLLFSCELPVTFEEPQPAGASGLNQFPAKLQGNYRSLSDNSTLKITSKYLIRIYNEKLLLHKSELDTGFTFNGNMLTETKTGAKYKARISGDSVIAFFHATDTVFPFPRIIF